MRAFSRGIFWALWIWAVGLPHFVALPFLIRFWGWKEARLFAGFSLVVLSLYLGAEIGVIRGLPFSSPLNECRITFNVTYIQICCLGAISLPVLLQGLLFELWWVPLVAGIVLLVLTWFVVHWRLGDLEQEMRWRLHSLKMGMNRMFKEIE